MPTADDDVNDDLTWAKKCGVKFSLATYDDIEELKEYLRHNFHADEPLHKNFDVSNGEGLIDVYARYLTNNEYLVAPIEKNDAEIPCSIIARNLSDNRIVAARIGVIYNKRTDNLKESGFVGNWIGELPSFLNIPHKFICAVNAQSLMSDLHFSKLDAFNELTDSGDSIYFACSLSVSAEVRGKGLGAELLRRGYKIAKESGCKYTYVLATSLYSQRIFQKLGGVRVLHEARYENYRFDKRGRPFLVDTGVHEVIQVLAIDHEVEG